MATYQMRDIEDIVANIEGWLTSGEGKFLYAKAKTCPEYAAIVEIGSYKGKSTICLAAGATAGNGAPVYAIDPHTGGSFKEFRKNIEKAGVQGMVTPIVKTSEKGSQDWQHPIGMLFIDGDHRYAAVEQDFLLWFPRLIDGGVVALHDTTSSLRNHLSGYPGPKKVAEQYMFKSTAVSEVDFIDTMTFGIKRRNIRISMQSFETVY